MKYPARLVPFEKLMYFLDQPDYPNSLGIRIRFEGRIDRAAALAAAETVFQRHPGFQVTVDPDRLRYVDPGAPFRNFRWIELKTDDEPFQLAPTDVHRDGGCMFWFVAGPARSDVALIGNHTLGDGIAGLQVISDWLLEYDRLVTSSESKLSRLDPQRLLRRGNLNLLNRKFLSKLIFQPIALFGASKFLFRRTVSLLPPPREAAQATVAYANVLTRRLSREQTDHAKWLATSSGVMLGEWITASYFRALAQWRSRHTVQSEKDWIRLLVPMSIRTMADRRLTGCNRVSFVQIDRRPRQMRDPKKLLAGIARELRVIRLWQLDRTLLVALRLANLIPGQIKRLATGSGMRATSLLTNLGNPFDRLPLRREGRNVVVGNLQWLDFDLLTPTLRGMPILAAVSEFQSELAISLNFDPRFVTAAQVDELHEDFQEALRGDSAVP